MSLPVGRNVVLFGFSMLFGFTVRFGLRRFRSVSGSGVRAVRRDVSTANFRMAATVWLISMWLALAAPLLCKDNQA
jgi:hypothetical protein